MKARTQRLYILTVSLLCIATAIGLILYALQENITFFFTPSELGHKDIPKSRNIRLGGMVEKGSLKQDGLDIHFTITDFKKTIAVYFHGIAPALFKEGQGVVAEGRLVNENLFEASTLLAKHDEKYMPPEIAGIAEGKKQ